MDDEEDMDEDTSNIDSSVNLTPSVQDESKSTLGTMKSQTASKASKASKIQSAVLTATGSIKSDTEVEGRSQASSPSVRTDQMDDEASVTTFKSDEEVGKTPSVPLNGKKTSLDRLEKEQPEQAQRTRTGRLHRQCQRRFREIIGKREMKNEELEKQQGDLKQRLNILECSMPAVMVWNVWRMSQGASVPSLRRVLEKQFQGPASGEVYCPSTPSRHFDCRVREIEAERKQAQKRVEEARTLWAEKVTALEEREKKLEEAKKCQDERRERIEQLTLEAKKLREARGSPEDDGSCQTGECGVIECKKKWLEKVPSGASIRSTDIECLEKLQQLAETELNMKRQIADLERREEDYMRTLQQADELWSRLDGDAASTLSGLQEQLDMKTAANQQMASRICQLEDELEMLRSKMASCRSELEKFLSVEKIEALIGRDDDFAAVVDGASAAGITMKHSMIGRDDDLAGVDEKDVLMKEEMAEKDVSARPDVDDARLGIRPEDFEHEEAKLIEIRRYLSQLSSLSLLDENDDYVCPADFVCNDLELTETGLTEEERIALEEKRVTAKELLERELAMIGAMEPVQVEQVGYRMKDEGGETKQEVKQEVKSEEKLEMDVSDERTPSGDVYEDATAEEVGEVSVKEDVGSEVLDEEAGTEEIGPDESVEYGTDSAPYEDNVLVLRNDLLTWQNDVHVVRETIAKCPECRVVQKEADKMAEMLARYTGTELEEVGREDIPLEKELKVEEEMAPEEPAEIEVKLEPEEEFEAEIEEVEVEVAEKEEVEEEEVEEEKEEEEEEEEVEEKEGLEVEEMREAPVIEEEVVEAVPTFEVAEEEEKEDETAIIPEAEMEASVIVEVDYPPEPPTSPILGDVSEVFDETSIPEVARRLDEVEASVEVKEEMVEDHEEEIPVRVIVDEELEVEEGEQEVKETEETEPEILEDVEPAVVEAPVRIEVEEEVDREEVSPVVEVEVETEEEEITVIEEVATIEEERVLPEEKEEAEIEVVPVKEEVRAAEEEEVEVTVEVLSVKEEVPAVEEGEVEIEVEVLPKEAEIEVEEELLEQEGEEGVIEIDIEKEEVEVPEEEVEVKVEVTEEEVEVKVEEIPEEEEEVEVKIEEEEVEVKVEEEEVEVKIEEEEGEVKVEEEEVEVKIEEEELEVKVEEVSEEEAEEEVEVKMEEVSEEEAEEEVEVKMEEIPEEEAEEEVEVKVEEIPEEEEEIEVKVEVLPEEVEEPKLEEEIEVEIEKVPEEEEGIEAEVEVLPEEAEEPKLEEEIEVEIEEVPEEEEGIEVEVEVLPEEVEEPKSEEEIEVEIEEVPKEEEPEIPTPERPDEEISLPCVCEEIPSVPSETSPTIEAGEISLPCVCDGTPSVLSETSPTTEVEEISLSCVCEGTPSVSQKTPSIVKTETIPSTCVCEGLPRDAQKVPPSCTCLSGTSRPCACLSGIPPSCTCIPGIPPSCTCLSGTSPAESSKEVGVRKIEPSEDTMSTQSPRKEEVRKMEPSEDTLSTESPWKKEVTKMEPSEDILPTESPRKKEITKMEPSEDIPFTEPPMRMEVTQTEIIQTEITQMAMSRTTIQVVTQTVADVGTQMQPAQRTVASPQHPKVATATTDTDPEPEVLERAAHRKKPSKDPSMITTTTATSQTVKSSVLQILRSLRSSGAYSKIDPEQELRSIQYGKPGEMDRRCNCCMCGKMTPEKSSLMSSTTTTESRQSSSVIRFLAALPTLKETEPPGTDQAVQHESFCPGCKMKKLQRSLKSQESPKLSAKVAKKPTRDQEVNACGNCTRRTSFLKHKPTSDQSCMVKIIKTKAPRAKREESLCEKVYVGMEPQETVEAPKEEDKEEDEVEDCVCGTTMETEAGKVKKVRCACGDPD